MVMKKIIINEETKKRLFNENVNGVFRLYQGTTYDALEDIMYEGEINASNGRQHGETRGVNWFTTEYSENFTRGVVISIEVAQEDFDENRFTYMNRKEVTSRGEYSKSIPLENRNFRIEKFGAISSKNNFDVLHNILNIKKNDVYDTVHLIDRVNENNPEYIPLLSPANPIFIMLMKQIGMEELLKNEGLI